jgi:hypothetical protein
MSSAKMQDADEQNSRFGLQEKPLGNPHPESWLAGRAPFSATCWVAGQLRAMKNGNGT